MQEKFCHGHQLNVKKALGIFCLLLLHHKIYVITRVGCFGLTEFSRLPPTWYLFVLNRSAIEMPVSLLSWAFMALRRSQIKCSYPSVLLGTSALLILQPQWALLIVLQMRFSAWKRRVAHASCKFKIQLYSIHCVPQNLLKRKQH